MAAANLGDIPRRASVESPGRPQRVVVVGAGIAGLAAALRIAEAAPAVELAVCEAGPRAGGVIATERDGGCLIEAGPDSFLTEKPETARLCERLGIAGGLTGVQPAASRAYVVHGGRLVAIPEGFRLVAPTRVWPWLRSPLFSWPGKLRTATELVRPRGPARTDESVASFVVRRFGREVFDRVAQPLIGTIYTADAAALSLAATMPRLLEFERRYGSVIRGFAQARGAPGRAAGPGADAARRLGMFATLANGMQALPDAAAARLPAGVLRLRARVVELGHALGGAGYTVRLADGTAHHAGAVVLAVDAPAAGRLLGGLDGALHAQLGSIAHASSVAVTLAYRRAEIIHPLDAVGFVVPRAERRPILAATFSSAKFPGRAPGDAALVRTFLGGALAPALVELDDARLVEIVRGELAALLGAAGTPHLVRIHRHRAAMPQYAVGHLDRVAEIDRRLEALPGLALAGAGYRGVGISDCIRSGEAAADRVLDAIRAPTAADRARREVRPLPG